MNGIAEWLDSIGLDEYTERFVENRIDLDNLLAIDDADLRELNVPLGDRKRILAAIETHAGSLQRSAARSMHVAADNRERRLLVVLFCDLVESTRFATHLDPEDLGKIIEPYREAVRRVIERHQGLTLIYEGDGIKAYFGSRVASEDDQEQALGASLEILDDVSRLNLSYAENLAVRIGVTTGTVIIGGFDAPTGPNAFGEALHLAARLQAAAAPNTILVDQATYRSMRAAFEFEDAGERPLKGFDQPVQTWRVTGKKPVKSRFAKRYRHTGLVGRETELTRLLEVWGRVRTEHGGTVVRLTGEAGIGKSRLAHELERHVDTDGGGVLLFQCSPHHVDATFHPILETLGNAIGIGPELGEGEKIERLRAFLSHRNIPLDLSLPIFSHLFGIRGAGAPASELSSGRQAEISRKVLTDHVLSLSRERPTLLLVEDAHWIDASSRAFFLGLADVLVDAPILLVMTSRDENLPPGESIPSESLSLQRLSAAESRALLDEVAAGKELPEEFRRFIERKAEGVPLFIEELALTIIETGLKEAGPAEVSTEADRIEISGILQSSLQSRLDRLGKAKEVAQLAATIGREFDLELLQRVTTMKRESLVGSLDKLMKAEIVFRKEPPARNVFVFKHALIQDTARGLLSRERRSETHRRIAGALTSRLMETGKAEPQLVAHHCFEGADYDGAARHWLEAGRTAAATWAKSEALQLLRKGLDAARRMEASKARMRLELDLEIEIGDVLYASFGYITTEGQAAYDRSLELSESLGDLDAPVRALDGLFGIHFNSGDFERTIAISDRLICLGEAHDKLSALVLGRQFKGMSQFCRGEFESADALLSSALGHVERADEVGSDFPSMAYIYLSWTRFVRGRRDEAVHAFDQARSIVRVQAPYRKAACLGDGCILYAMMDDPDQVEALARDLVPLAAKYGFNMWLNMARFFKGWTAAMRGDASGLDEMERTMVALGEQEVDRTLYLGVLARTRLDAGLADAAAEALEEGLAQARKSGENYFTAELMRVKARWLIETRGDLAAGRALLEKTVELARRQGARSWVERATRYLNSTRVRIAGS